MEVALENFPILLDRSGLDRRGEARPEDESSRLIAYLPTLLDRRGFRSEPEGLSMGIDLRETRSPPLPDPSRVLPSDTTTDRLRSTPLPEPSLAEVECFELRVSDIFRNGRIGDTISPSTPSRLGIGFLVDLGDPNVLSMLVSFVDSDFLDALLGDPIPPLAAFLSRSLGENLS